MKHFEVTFSPVALDDVEETKAYYEKIQAGLGKALQYNCRLHLIPSGKIPSLLLLDMITSAAQE